MRFKNPVDVGNAMMAFELSCMVYESRHVSRIFDLAIGQMSKTVLSMLKNKNYSFNQLYYSGFSYVCDVNTGFEKVLKTGIDVAKSSKWFHPICFYFYKDDELQSEMQTVPRNFNFLNLAKDLIKIGVNASQKCRFDENRLKTSFSHEFVHVRQMWRRNDHNVLDKPYQKLYQKFEQDLNREDVRFSNSNYKRLVFEILYMTTETERSANLTEIRNVLDCADPVKIADGLRGKGNHEKVEWLVFDYHDDFTRVRFLENCMKILKSEMKNERFEPLLVIGHYLVQANMMKDPSGGTDIKLVLSIQKASRNGNEALKLYLNQNPEVKEKTSASATAVFLKLNDVFTKYLWKVREVVFDFLEDNELLENTDLKFYSALNEIKHPKSEVYGNAPQLSDEEMLEAYLMPPSAYLKLLDKMKNKKNYKNS